MRRSHECRPFRPPDWGPPPPHRYRYHHHHHQHQHQHQRYRLARPPPPQFAVILLRAGPNFSTPPATEIEALVAGLPSPVPDNLSVRSSGRHAARLLFRSLPAAAAAARELWSLRLEGLHFLTPHLTEPALASHARPLIASLFAAHASRLLDSDLVSLSTSRSAELAASIQAVKQRLGARNRVRDFNQLHLQKKTLEAEKDMVDAKIAEYESAMRSIRRAMLRRTEEEVFGIGEGEEMDFARVHMMMLGEGRRLKEGLPIYAYRRKILNHICANQDDKEPQLTSRKRRKSADNDIGDKSDSCLQKRLNMSVQDMVKETKQMPLAQFSPSHSPSMKRARPLGQDQLASPSSCQPAVPSPSQSSQRASVAQLADELEQSLDMRPEVPEAGEPAQAAVAAGAGVPTQAVEAAVFPDVTAPAAVVDPPPALIIEHLEGLSQLAEALVRKPMNYCGPNGKKARKSLLTAGVDGKKYQTGINFYERARTATDERFWSIEQQDLYTSAYGVKKNFAKNKWIDWDGIRPYEEFQYVEKKCHDTGLHRVMAARHDWHVETIKQFFATFYINPSRTSLTWMTGINRKITITKRFWEEILLDLSVHDGRNDYPKIKGSLTDKEEEQLRNANPTLINATNRMLRTTIFPKAGDKTTVHNENKLILYHVLFGKPFDVVDMMLREIQKTRRDTRMLIPYAPYIMLLIKCATREEFVSESGGTAWFEHPKYNIMPQKPRQPRNIRASKSKQPFRVAPRPALVAPPLVPAVAGAAATLVAAAPAVPPLAPVRDPVAAEPPQPVDRHAQSPCQCEVGQCLLECLKHRSKEECLKDMLSEVPPERALPVVGDYLTSLPPRIQHQLCFSQR